MDKYVLKTPPTKQEILDYFAGKEKVSFHLTWFSGSNEVLADYDTSGFYGAGAVYVRDIRSASCSNFGYSITDSPNDKSIWEHYDYQGFIRVNGSNEAINVLISIIGKLKAQGCVFNDGFLEC
jgi:hypothetical protein